MSRKNIDRFSSQIFGPQTLGSPSKQSEASEKQLDSTSQATKDINICTGGPQMKIVETFTIFHIYIAKTTFNLFTQFRFWFRQCTIYISSATISLIVFYYSFNGNIRRFNMCLQIRCLGFYHCISILYALFLDKIFLLIAPHPNMFRQIVLDLPGQISELNMWAIIIASLFSLCLTWVYGSVCLVATFAF